MKKEKGFTLIELMIVVAIIGILAAIAIPRFAQLIDKAREAGARGNLGALRSAVAVYYGDNKGQWPKGLDDKTDYKNAENEPLPAFVPNYMGKMPKATLKRDSSVQDHSNKDTVKIISTKSNEEITSGFDDKGGWVYSSNSGDVRINCTHKDSMIENNSASTVCYSNYGHEEQ